MGLSLFHGRKSHIIAVKGGQHPVDILGEIQLYVFKLVFYHRKDPCLFDGVPMGTGIAGEAQPPRVCMLIFSALLQAAPVDPSGRDMKKLQAAVNGLYKHFLEVNLC